MYASPYAAGLGPRSQHAYADLKRRLLLGEFPLNQRLAEETLAAELGVSRTPVHEALSRLQAERLVERQPRGGFFPATPAFAETRDLYEVRLALENDAISRPLRSGEAHDRDQLMALRDDWEGLDAPDDDAPDQGADPEFVLLDEDFHVRLATAAGNLALADMLQQVNERIRPVRTHDFMTFGRIGLTIEQHLGIVGALLADDTKQAGKLLALHIGESMSVVEQRVAAAFARMSRRPPPQARPAAPSPETDPSPDPPTPSPTSPSTPTGTGPRRRSRGRPIPSTDKRRQR
jgi:DNA-binding GntR family transcriptional regulator